MLFRSGTGGASLSVADARMNGDQIRFAVLDKAGVRQEFTGRVQGNQMTGTVRTNGQEAPFTATKK